MEALEAVREPPEERRRRPGSRGAPPRRSAGTSAARGPSASDRLTVTAIATFEAGVPTSGCAERDHLTTIHRADRALEAVPVDVDDDCGPFARAERVEHFGRDDDAGVVPGRGEDGLEGHAASFLLAAMSPPILDRSLERLPRVRGTPAAMTVGITPGRGPARRRRRAGCGASRRRRRCRAAGRWPAPGAA